MDSSSAKSFLHRLRSRFKWEAPVTKRDKPFILPTRWGALVGFICFFLLIMAFGYQNNLVYLFTFFFTGLGLAAMLQAHENLRPVTLYYKTHEVFFAGETGMLVLALENHSDQAKFQIQICIGDDKKLTDLTVHLAPREIQEIRLPWLCSKRGRQKLPIFSVFSQFPFSLLQPWKRFRFSNEVLVYPERRGARPLPQFSGGRTESSLAGVKNSAGQSEFWGHQPWTESHSIRRLDWRVKARTDQNLMQDWRENPSQLTTHIRWQDSEGLPSFEDRVAQTCKWVNEVQLEKQKLILQLQDAEISGAEPQAFQKAYERLALLEETK